MAMGVAIMMLIKTLAKMNAFVEYYDVQGSTSCAILPSWMGEHGISWESREKMENTENTENTENMENTQNKEKMENICQMTATFY